ncbi:hypothetical protein B0H14DRAFT_2626170 [Mycena olivaceomarginata]|nr:hypothetical protein B0H14DRAFT_2626170 [Mycena olivaceomarginata]
MSILAVCNALVTADPFMLPGAYKAVSVFRGVLGNTVPHRVGFLAYGYGASGARTWLSQFPSSASEYGIGYGKRREGSGCSRPKLGFVILYKPHNGLHTTQDLQWYAYRYTYFPLLVMTAVQRTPLRLD